MPFRPPRSDDEAMAKLASRFQARPMLQELDLELTSIELVEGRVVCTIADPSERIRNQGGSVHGGVLALLADVVAGCGVICSIAEEDWCATTELNITYLRRFRTPPLTIEARALHRGARVHSWAVSFRCGRERLVAEARVGFLIGRGGPV